MLLRLLLAAALLGACSAPVTPPAGSAAHAAPRAAPAAPASAPLAPELERLVAAVEEQRVEMHAAGLALAVVRGDELVLARGFGLADVEGARAVTPTTTFAIGSTSKAFTATLAEMLVAEGRLALDDPLTKHLPWFTCRPDGPEGAELTLRDALSHRSGFARMDVLWYGERADADLVLRTAAQAEPVAPLRTRFLYNNVMFLAAGRVCAEVAGQSWDELVRRRFFEPLGMARTGTTLAEAQADPELALGYQWNAETSTLERKRMKDLASIAPAGAITSNVLDLTRWLRFQLARGEFEGRRLIPEERLLETWTPQQEIQGGTADYGLGWIVTHWQKQRLIEHDGAIDGFSAKVGFLPEAGLGFVVLANGGGLALGGVEQLVLRALAGEPDAAPAVSDGDDLARYEGTYLANFFQFHEAEFTVTARDGRLFVDIPGQMNFELGPPDAEGKRPFVLLPEQIQARFQADASGDVVALEIAQAGFVFENLRRGYEPPPEIPLAELEPLLGSFHDPLTDKTFTLVIRHNRLAVDYPEQMVYELRPPDARNRRQFRACDVFALELEPDADGQIDELVFHERGTERVCARVDRAAELPSLADVLLLRRAGEFEARLAELGRCRLSGTLRFLNSGVAGTTTTEFEADGRYHDRADLAPFIATETTFDGARVQYRSTFEELQELAGENADQARAGSPPLFFGDWSRHFERAVVKGLDDSGGKKTIAVELRKGAAPPMTVYVDAVTGDLVRAEVHELVAGAGSLPKTLTFEDWRELEGLRLPLRIVSDDDGAGRAVIQFETLETHLLAEPGAYELR